MRRILAALAALLLILSFPLGTMAATGASKIQSYTTAAADGSCQVNLTVTFHMESPVERLKFPVPGNAKNVTVNGSRARTQRMGEALAVDLSGLFGGIAGDFSVTVSYTLGSIVAENETGNHVVTLELLSGFAYPVEIMEFSVTLPGDFSDKPGFHSVYRQAGIEEDLTYTINGNTISGSFVKPLKDRESVTMTLGVPDTMFPREPAKEVNLNLLAILAAVPAGLALLYWLIFLQCLPPKRIRRTTPPEGVTAGELGSVLIMGGADLTMMVLTWAQLGYILIQMDDSNRVLLHKRMEMGNERGPFENRWFQALFGKKQMVEGSGLRYAKLCRKIALLPSHTHSYYRKGSGNPRIFRFLAALAGAAGGLTLGAALNVGPGIRWLILCLAAALGFAGSWRIQDWAKSLHLRDMQPVRLTVLLGALWLLAGILTHRLGAAVLVVLGQLLAGLMAAYGGRRTEQGKQVAGQVLGLRRYLKTVPAETLHHILKTNPEYFYTLAPYALAMGVDQAFARRFGTAKLPGCTYLTTGRDGHMTASEWSRLIRRTVDSMDARQKELRRRGIAR